MKKAICMILVLVLTFAYGCKSDLRNEKTPVIIDCDPGMDDTVALCLAASSDRLDIKAVTSVYGNHYLSRTTFNLLSICDLLNLQVPVFTGSEYPMKSTINPALNFHGLNGIGNVILPPTSRVAEKGKAWDAIYNEALNNGGELQIIALGPLTNIAHAIEKYPDLPVMIDKIIVMGGSTSEGNETEYAEYNIFCDPEAAQIVFASDIEIVMVGLNATNSMAITEDQIKSMAQNGTVLKDFFDELTPWLSHLYPSATKMELHDPSAVAYAIMPEIASVYKAKVSVETADNERRGQTLVEKDKHGNVTVVESIDYENMLPLIQRMFEYSQSANSQLTPYKDLCTQAENSVLKLSTEGIDVVNTDEQRTWLEHIIQGDKTISFQFMDYYADLNSENVSSYINTGNEVHVVQDGTVYDVTPSQSGVGYSGTNKPIVRAYSFSYVETNFKPDSDYHIEYNGTVIHPKGQFESKPEIVASFNSTIYTNLLAHWLNVGNNNYILYFTTSASHALVNVRSDSFIIGYPEAPQRPVVPDKYRLLEFDVFSFEENSVIQLFEFDALIHSIIDVANPVEFTLDISESPQTIDLASNSITISCVKIENNKLTIEIDATSDMELVAFLGTNEDWNMLIESGVEEAPGLVATYDALNSKLEFACKEPLSGQITILIPFYSVSEYIPNYIVL